MIYDVALSVAVVVGYSLLFLTLRQSKTRSRHAATVVHTPDPELRELQSDLRQLRREFNDLDAAMERRFKSLTQFIRRERRRDDESEREPATEPDELAALREAVLGGNGAAAPLPPGAAARAPFPNPPRRTR